MLPIAILLACAAAATPAARDGPTLRGELQKHGIDGSALPDADRRITSYAVAADASRFSIAYYWDEGTPLLPKELRLRTLARKTGAWRSVVIDREAVAGGSAVGISHQGRLIYLDLHVTPSAGALIVLSDDLRVRKRLNGWSSLILPDGRVIYEHSMVHFAPAHPGSVGMYDPRTDRDVRLYPARADAPQGTRVIDRAIVTIERRGGAIHILAREQDVDIAADGRGIPSGPARERSVVCDLSRAAARCSVR